MKLSKEELAAKKADLANKEIDQLLDECGAYSHTYGFSVETFFDKMKDQTIKNRFIENLKNLS